jgi:hypothetical protein
MACPRECNPLSACSHSGIIRRKGERKYNPPTMPHGYRVDVQLVAARQLLACGAEAVAASAGDERYLQEQLEHFKMQLHPTFNPSAKKLPFQSS